MAMILGCLLVAILGWLLVQEARIQVMRYKWIKNFRTANRNFEHLAAVTDAQQRRIRELEGRADSLEGEIHVCPLQRGRR